MVVQLIRFKLIEIVSLLFLLIIVINCFGEKSSSKSPTLNNLGYEFSKGSEDDIKYMRRAIELASRAIGQTSPNPCVGCVIVDEMNQVIGEGWHVKAGQAHAEVVALAQASERAKGATAYVSLEPCNHYGRTPPCTLALLKHGIKRVVVGMVDPDPRVSGTGLAFLRDNGIEVSVGIEHVECETLNLPFIYRVLHRQPFVVAMAEIITNSTLDTNIVNIETKLEEEEKEEENELLHIRRPEFTSISSHLNSVAPEIDTILIEGDYFINQPIESFTTSSNLSPHISIMILIPSNKDNGSIDSTSYNDIRNHIDAIRSSSSSSSSVVSSSEKQRQWILVFDSIEEKEKYHQENRDKDIYDYDNKITFSESNHNNNIVTIFSNKLLITEVLGKAAGLGSNAILILLNDYDSINHLYNSQLIQKFIIASSTSTSTSTSISNSDVNNNNNHNNNNDNNNSGNYFLVNRLIKKLEDSKIISNSDINVNDGDDKLRDFHQSIISIKDEISGNTKRSLHSFRLWGWSSSPPSSTSSSSSSS